VPHGADHTAIYAIYKDARRPAEIPCGVTPGAATNEEVSPGCRHLKCLPWPHRAVTRCQRGRAMTRSGLAVVTIALTLALGLFDRAAAEPWTISEHGVVTRHDLHPNGPPPNPLRHVPDELLLKLR